MKACTKCGVPKESAAFAPERRGRDGLRSRCKSCCSASAYAWNLQNPDRYAKSRLRYREAHRSEAVAAARAWARRNPEKALENTNRRRARLANAPAIEMIDRNYIIDRDGCRCHICGKKVRRSQVTLDHLVPLSRGGGHTALNLRVAHLSCNSRRGAGRLPAQLLLVA